MSLNPTARTRRRLAVAATAVATLTLGACGDLTSSTSSDADAPVDSLKIIVPAEPGGGWDQTGRAMQTALQDSELLDDTEVVNVGGAGGTVGLAQLANEKNPNTLMVMGYVMVGAVETNDPDKTLADTTPIASLTEEQLVVVVPKDSPYETIDDLTADAESKGRGVSIAGGSAGGADHILAGLVYEEAGIDPADLNYVPFSGGGESVAALLGGKVDAGISGVQEYAEQVKSGELRALAVSGEEEVRDLPDVPTLTDEGLDVVVNNWRGVVAPGNIDEAQADKLTDLVTELHDTDEWATALDDNGWVDAFMTGDEFSAFLEEDIQTVRETLKQIGLI